MVKIQRTKKGQYWITIPLTVIKIMGWEKGTVLYEGINKHKDLVLSPKERKYGKKIREASLHQDS